VEVAAVWRALCRVIARFGRFVVEVVLCG
jgi:hypothetical protein